MTGADDRSSGSIGQLFLAWGMSPERARRAEAIASALLAEADAAGQRSTWADGPCNRSRRDDAHPPPKTEAQ
jgi:hypothetical protein